MQQPLDGKEVKEATPASAAPSDEHLILRVRRDEFRQNPKRVVFAPPVQKG